MQSTEERRFAEDPLGRPPLAPEVAEGLGEILLAQLPPARVGHQRMVKVAGRGAAAEEPHQTELAPGGFEDVLAADHEGDLLGQVVRYRTELVGPLPLAVLEYEVATLRGRVLGDDAEAQIVEPF